MVPLKIVLSLAIMVFAGYFSIVVCPLIWSSLSYTVHEPKLEDFCGRYVPMPGTARFLSEKYPGIQTWMEFNRDGSFVFNDIPAGSRSGNSTATKTESGKWGLKNRSGRVWLTLSDGGEPLLYSGLHLKGQKPPYIIERWTEFPMEFCTNPQQSPEVRAYETLSITDWAIQGFIALSVLVFPFLLKPESGGRAFGYPFMIIFVWGIWRMAYYDGATHNDIPGIGYFVAAFIYALIARAIFAIRCAVSRWITMRKDTQSASGGNER